MSCKIVKLNNCEIAGTTFESRTLTITGGVISSAKIVVKNTFNKVLKEVEGEVLGNKISFSFNDLESLPAGTYYVEYWTEIEDIGREVVALEELKVSHAKDSRCDCTSEADIAGNIVFQKKEIAVNLIKNIVQKERPQEEKVVFMKDFERILTDTLNKRSRTTRKILTKDFNTDELDIEVPDLSVELKKDTTYRVSAYIISQCGEGTYMGLTNGERYMNFEIAERESKVAEWIKFVGDNIEYSHFLFIDDIGRVFKIFDFLQSEDTVYRGDYGVVFCKIEGCIRVKKDMKLGIILKSEEGENISKKIKKGSFLEIEEL